MNFSYREVIIDTRERRPDTCTHYSLWTLHPTLFFYSADDDAEEASREAEDKDSEKFLKATAAGEERCNLQRLLEQGVISPDEFNAMDAQH